MSSGEPNGVTLNHPGRLHAGLVLSTAALSFVGYAALLTTGNYPPAILLLPLLSVALGPIGERMDARFPSYKYATSFGALVFVGLMFLAVPVFGLLEPVTWLVVFIHIYKYAHRKARRDYYQIFLMAFFLFIAACAQNPGPGMGPVMILLLLCTVWAFIMLHMYFEASSVAARSCFPEIFPAREANGAVSSAPIRVPFIGITTAVAGAGVTCLLFTLILFLFTPRTEAGFLGHSNVVTQHTGLGEGINLAGGGAIREDPAPIMRVEFPDEPENQFSGPLYWRVTSFDSYLASRWERTGAMRVSRDDAFQSALTTFARIAGRDKGPPPYHRRVRQLIYLDEVTLEGLPCLPFVASAESGTEDFYWDPMGDYTLKLQRAERLHYEVLSDVAEFPEDALRAAPSNYRESMPRQDYMILTSHNLSRPAAQIARQLTEHAPTAYDKVLAVQQWLSSESFVYTANVPNYPQYGAVDFFIAQVRRGHCQLFASAMALMLRSQGIPARVAKGYRGGEWNPAERAYYVRRSMAHLWVEVYFLDLGWVTFDPSPPPEPVTDRQAVGVTRLISRYLLSARMMWYRDILGYRGRIQWDRLQQTALRLIRFDVDVEEGVFSGRQFWNRLPAFLAFAGLLTALSAVIALAALRVRALRRLPAAAFTRDQRRAIRLYARLRRKLHRCGIDTRGKTADEIARELADLSFPGTPSSALVVERYNQVRFGGRPLPMAELASLMRAIRQIPVART